MQKLALTNTYNWKNTDKRMQTAWEFYTRYKNGFYMIYKTTRAGCTTALVAASLNLNERFLIVVPTNAIADKTVLVDAEKYSDRSKTNIIKIPANHKCLINDEMCKQWPDLKMLPILPLAQKCEECKCYNDCPVTEILRYGSVCDGVSITYHKMTALMMAESAGSKIAMQVIDKIRELHNTIFDEVHELQYGRTVSLTYYNNGKPMSTNQYLPILEDYPNIRKAVVNFSLFTTEMEKKHEFMKMYNDADSKDYFKHKLSWTVNNNYCNLSQGIKEDNTKVQMAIYQEIIELTKNRGDYDLDMRDIIQLYDITSVAMSEKIVIHGIKDRGVIKINLVVIDEFFNKLIRSYIKSIQAKSKRIMLTSATICSHDYDKYFMNNIRPVNVLFGENGDPMANNSKMLILADSKKYHMAGRNSLKQALEEIATKIIQILELYGEDNCMVVATNKKDSYTLANALKTFGKPHAVTWYKANDTIGVSSHARVCIAVGAAHKPSNSFDAITDTKEESLILREEAMHCDTWQAWSRVKDPAGIEQSLVFAIGVTEEYCRNIVEWGFDRAVHIEEYNAEKREKKNVIVECADQNISKPDILKCRGVDEMITTAMLRKPCKNLVNSQGEKYLLYNIIRYFSRSQLTKNSQCSFLRMFFTRNDVYAEQTFRGEYMKVSGCITDELLENHSKGKITLGAYCLSQDNLVHWMCFDIDAHRSADDTDETLKAKQDQSEDERTKLCNFFDSTDIPYLLESSGTPYSYHIWVFLKPVEAAKAKHFGKRVLQECGIKKMEVFPKQEKLNKNGYGNLVKLPLAINRKNGNKSKIWLNGEWVEDFESITVGAIDISSYTLPEVKKIECQKPDKVEGVRDIFKWALTQSLTGEQGHWMRIAIVREYYNNGTKEPEKLAELFKSQLDYDPEYSYKAVLSIIKDDYGCWKWETIVNRCPDLVKKYNERK